jgi:O-methyltransferase
MKYTGDIVSTNANSGFMSEAKFIEAYKACVAADKGRLLLADSSYDIRWRIHTLLWAAKNAEKLEGDFVECGAGFGLFASAIFSYLDFGNLSKNYYLIDTFEGLSAKDSTREELARTGDYYTKNNPWFDEISDSFSKFPNAKIVKGAIPDILSEVNIDKVSFMSIDMNTVAPEAAALEFFWPKLVSGGIIIFDDYGFPGHENQKISHDAFAASKNLLIYTSPTGQGILIKP